MKPRQRTAALKKFLDAKPGAVAEPFTAPRGSTPLALIYKVMGKMFAILSLRDDEHVIVKCEAQQVDMLHAQYTGVGHRSHLDRRYWICIDLNADVPVTVIKQLAGQSHELVCAKLTRKQQTELTAASAKNSPAE